MQPELVDCALAAVDKDGLASDEIGCRGSEEQGRLNHVFHLCDTAHRDLGRDRIVFFRRQCLDHLSVDIARADTVDIDCLAVSVCKTFSQGLGNLQVSALGCGISGNVVADCEAAERTDKDDLAVAAAFLLQHDLSCTLCKSVAVNNIDALNLQELFQWELLRLSR